VKRCALASATSYHGPRFGASMRALTVSASARLGCVRSASLFHCVIVAGLPASPRGTKLPRGLCSRKVQTRGRQGDQSSLYSECTTVPSGSISNVYIPAFVLATGPQLARGSVQRTPSIPCKDGCPAALLGEDFAVADHARQARATSDKRNECRCLHMSRVRHPTGIVSAATSRACGV